MEDSGTDPTLVYKEGRHGGLAIWGLLMEDLLTARRSLCGSVSSLRWPGPAPTLQRY